MAIAKVLALVVLASTCYGALVVENMFDKRSIDRSLVATYDDIMQLQEQKQPEVLLIDVRRPEDLKSTGVMPCSINIPLETLQEDLQLDPKTFEGKFGRKKPTLSTPMIFSSRTGERAGDAANIAHKLGFKEVKSYVGSWDEFARIKGLRQE